MRGAKLGRRGMGVLAALPLQRNRSERPQRPPQPPPALPSARELTIAGAFSICCGP